MEVHLQKLAKQFIETSSLLRETKGGQISTEQIEADADYLQMAGQFCDLLSQQKTNAENSTSRSLIPPQTGSDHAGQGEKDGDTRDLLKTL